MLRKSHALVIRLLAASTKEERDEIVSRLVARDDPQVVPLLVQTLLDETVPDAARDAVSNALQGMENAPDATDDQLREWWSASDAVLRRHALGMMTVLQRDLVEAVLNELDHPLYADAVATLAFGFPKGWAAEQLTAALRHPHAPVRAVAAEALLWPEPAGAIESLLAVAHDEDARVVEAAFDALCCYPTRATIACAHALSMHPNGDVRTSASNCLAWMKGEVRAALSIVEHEPHLRDWLAQVWSLLDIGAQQSEQACEDSPKMAPPRAEPEDPPWLSRVAAFQRHLEEWDDMEDSVAVQLRRVNWSQVAESMRPEFGDVLLTSRDATVRRCAVRVFAAWRNRTGMLSLLRDDKPGVCKVAMYYLREFGPDPELSQIAWAHLPHALGTHASETLETAIALTDPSDWIPRVRAVGFWFRWPGSSLRRSD